MKGKISVLALTVVLLLGLSSSSALAAGSVTYLGKTTWTAKITADTHSEDIGIEFTFTGGISKVGDEFYLFQGYAIPEGDGPFVLSGSGFMNGDTLVFTLAESQEHTGQTHNDSGVMHISINKSSQSGTFYDIGTDFDIAGGTVGHRYTAGTLTLKGSPIPMNVTLAPFQLLME